MNSPIPNPYTDPDDFPDDSLTQAENYCRQPSGVHKVPWCLSSSAPEYWESCFNYACEGKMKKC